MQYDSAAQDYTFALEITPDDIQALTGRGSAYFLRSDYECVLFA